MMGVTELTALSLRAASDLLHRRAISPVELTEAYLVRIERWNPHVKAYLTVMAEDARAAARRAEAALVARTDRGLPAPRSSPTGSRPRTRRSCAASAVPAWSCWASAP